MLKFHFSCSTKNGSLCSNIIILIWLGILNSILDTSKIEAEKMQLEEEEFNVAKLAEDVVDLFYPLSLKKGVDIVLDPTDCSIFKHSVVKGDRAKLKQILCNSLSNALPSLHHKATSQFELWSANETK